MEDFSFLLKEISARETWPVRHPVLRKGRPLESCEFEGDELPGTFHLGLFDRDELVGVSTYLKATHKNFYGEQYQLRGMAVLENYQNQGLGNLLLEAAEERLKGMKIDLLWCNAREKAANFYKRAGYKISGDPFEIDPIGIHYLMYKELP